MLRLQVLRSCRREEMVIMKMPTQNNNISPAADCGNCIYMIRKNEGQNMAVCALHLTTISVSNRSVCDAYKLVSMR